MQRETLASLEITAAQSSIHVRASFAKSAVSYVERLHLFVHYEKFQEIIMNQDTRIVQPIHAIIHSVHNTANWHGCFASEVTCQR